VRLQVHPEFLEGPEVSGEADRRVYGDTALPCTISLIRRGGTPIDTASLCWVIPKPSMKSSKRISPGWIGSIESRSVVVDEFDMFGTSVSPNKANAPLRVHADAVLAATIPNELFQAIPRRDAQIVEVRGR